MSTPAACSCPTPERHWPGCPATPRDICEPWIEGPPEMDGRTYPAGVLLMVRPAVCGTEGRIILIGHVNERAGLCDDCTDGWTREDIIAHRYVWREGEL